MTAYIIDAGPFGIITLLLGLAALVLQGLALARPAGRDLRGAAVSTALAALLVGLAGTCMGLHQAALFLVAEPTSAHLWPRAVAVAASPLVLAAVPAALVALARAGSQLRANA